jgi:hypothetical protein
VRVVGGFFFLADEAAASIGVDAPHARVDLVEVDACNSSGLLPFFLLPFGVAAVWSIGLNPTNPACKKG